MSDFNRKLRQFEANAYSRYMRELDDDQAQQDYKEAVETEIRDEICGHPDLLDEALSEYLGAANPDQYNAWVQALYRFHINSYTAKGEKLVALCAALRNQLDDAIDWHVQQLAAKRIEEQQAAAEDDAAEIACYEREQ